LQEEKMPPSRAALRFCFFVVLSLCAATPAFAALSATANITTLSTSAPYTYAIHVHNTGTTNIGTFWFAWDPNSNYNFLPSVPTDIHEPNGWIAPVTHVFSGDGYGIEYYNISGSPIAPGATVEFHFASPDSPTTLTGNAWLPPFKITSSFTYIGFPETDPGFRLIASVAVPEPASLLMALFGLAYVCLPGPGTVVATVVRSLRCKMCLSSATDIVRLTASTGRTRKSGPPHRQARQRSCQSMRRAVQEVVSDVNIDVQYSISDLWAKSAEVVLDELGRLTVWKPVKIQRSEQMACKEAAVPMAVSA
jgi:hypothetical protein